MKECMFEEPMSVHFFANKVLNQIFDLPERNILKSNNNKKKLEKETGITQFVSFCSLAFNLRKEVNLAGKIVTIARERKSFLVLTVA